MLQKKNIIVQIKSIVFGSNTMIQYVKVKLKKKVKIVKLNEIKVIKQKVQNVVNIFNQNESQNSFVKKKFFNCINFINQYKTG